MNWVVTAAGSRQVTSAVMVTGPPSSAAVYADPVSSIPIGAGVAGGLRVTTEELLVRSGSARPTMVAVASTGPSPPNDHVVLHPPGVREVPAWVDVEGVPVVASVVEPVFVEGPAAVVGGRDRAPLVHVVDHVPEAQGAWHEGHARRERALHRARSRPGWARRYGTCVGRSGERPIPPARCRPRGRRSPRRRRWSARPAPPARCRRRWPSSPARSSPRWGT